MKPERSSKQAAADRIKPELLSPAGSVEALQAALKAGADAVYIGGRQFGARAYADNPDDAALLEAIDLVHMAGKRLYLTVNTLFKNREIEEGLTEWLAPFYRQGLDGVIIQDPGVVMLLKEAFPGLELHASTQMAITGASGARLMQEAGVCRVVPARELSLEEIRSIYDETGVEIECFVHGAMCYSYSGMCLMSSMIGGRSGNRGRCAGVCRLPFAVSQDGKRISRRGESYPLSMKDLCALDLLPDLIGAGCASFKIEGRMKRPEYTAGVTEIYRTYIDRWADDPGAYHVDPEDRRRLETLFNRDGLQDGYYRTRNGRSMIALRNVKIDESEARKRSQEAQAEYADIEQKLNRTELKRLCDAEVFLEVGKPVRLKLTLVTEPVCRNVYHAYPGEIRTEVTGDVVQSADRQPVSAERIEAQIRKTGDHPFTIRHVTMHVPDPNLFLPISRINDLRRRGLEMLREALLQPYRREDACAVQPVTSGTSKIDKHTESTGKEQYSETRPDLWIQVEREEQLQAIEREEQFQSFEREHQLQSIDRQSPAGDRLIDSFKIAGIALPLRMMESSAGVQAAEALKRSGRKLRLVLPYIIRLDHKDEIRELLTETVSRFPDLVDGIIVRSLEGLGLLLDLDRETGKKNNGSPYISLAIPDAGLFAWNDRAVRFYRSLGITRNTAPQELNRRELQHRDNAGSEMILYGRVPMMISAQCVKKTMQGCTHAHEILQLTDRKGAEFPVVCCCDDCYNVIYNSLPTSLLGQTAEVEEITGIRSFRIAFTTETAQQTARVLENPGDLPFAVTGGHYRRGVL